MILIKGLELTYQYDLCLLITDGALHVDYFYYLDGDKSGRITVEEVSAKSHFLYPT